MRTLFGVLGGLDIDAIGRAGGRAQEAGDALFQAVFVALQDVDAAKALLELGRLVGIVVGHRGRHHLLEGDAHSFGDRRGYTQDVQFVTHELISF